MITRVNPRQLLWRIAVLVVLFAICTLGLAPGLKNSQRSVFESELWPGEGIPVFRARIDLKLFKDCSHKSPVTTHRIRSGQKINYKETRYRTLKPGIVKVKTPASTMGTSYGRINYLSGNNYYSQGRPFNFHFTPGETFEYLQYRAEGSSLVRITGAVVELDLGDEFKVESEPITEWWVRVYGKNNRELGWALINEESVDFLERELG